MDATGVKTWRRQERMRLIAWRMGLSPGVRREWGERITAGLQNLSPTRSAKPPSQPRQFGLTSALRVAC